MPVLIRDTPLGRWLVEEGRQEAVLRLTELMLRRRFRDDLRIPAIAERLAILPDDERLARIADATTLDDLEG